MSASLQPLVSVIVPAYNAERFIADTLESIVGQTYENKEIIVVNDGSTDATSVICSDYIKQHSYIHLLTHKEQANRGVSWSREVGVTAAKGELIAFCDADDTMVPIKLERQVELLNKHPDVILCHSAINVFGPDKAFAERFEKAINFSGSPQVYDLLKKRYRLSRNAIANSTVMARKRALDAVRIGRDQLFQFEDWLLWVLMAQMGPFLYAPDKLVHYRFHSGSATARMVDSRLYNLYARLEMYMHLLVSLRHWKVGLRSEVIARISQTLLLIFRETKRG